MRRQKDTRETFNPHIPKEGFNLYLPCHVKEQIIVEAARLNKIPGKLVADAVEYYLKHFRQGRGLEEG